MAQHIGFGMDQVTFGSPQAELRGDVSKQAVTHSFLPIADLLQLKRLQSAPHSPYSINGCSVPQEKVHIIHIIESIAVEQRNWDIVGPFCLKLEG